MTLNSDVAAKTWNTLKITRHERGVVVVAISRPKALNALNTETLTELRAALRIEAKNADTRALILTGDGEKSFIAGADIVEMKDKSVIEGTEFSQLGQEVTKLLELMPKPTIAAVNGFALGGGCEMAIACDFILASERAVFGQPEVGLGIIPGFGATLRLARFVGWPMAKELIYTGAKIKADEALRIGLVNRIYPADTFMVSVLEVATAMASHSAYAVSHSKALMNEFSESIGLFSKLDAEAHAFGQAFTHPDQREGMAAFVEKRKPAFKGL